MEFLRADERPSEPGERVFRHHPLGPVVLLLALAAPLAAPWVLRDGLLASARALPWYGWLGLAPILLLVGLVYAVALQGAAQSARRAFLDSNWLLRVSAAGLTLNLRSFQNAHFPKDGPTVVRIPWHEIACVREARDVTPRKGRGASHQSSRWLELELVGVDTTALERLITAERERKGPESKTLGVTSSGRFGHVPVFVSSPGVVRTDWLGARMLHALGAHARLEERRSFELGAGIGAEARIEALLKRGDRLAAIELARRELGLALVDARAHVQSLARRIA